jgi:predicted phage-related endonuclease
VKIHSDFDQHSLAWLNIRAGRLTASEADRLVSPLGKVRTGEGVKTLMLEKLAERWMGAPLPKEASTFAMEQGNILEEFALPAFELETGMKLQRVAFIETDDGTCGCSPDAVVEGQEIGVEAKCPGIVNHLRYLLDGTLPPDYILQVQFSMFVTGWKEWMFTSFRRRMPPLIYRVYRDEEIQEAIRDAVREFNLRLENAWAALLELNGGKPPIRQTFPPTPGPVRFTWETNSEDVPT